MWDKIYVYALLKWLQAPMQLSPAKFVIEMIVEFVSVL
jgi:hypothetical protein